MKKWHVAAAAVLATVLGLTGLAVTQDAPKNNGKKTIQIEGSTTVGPIAEAFVEYFKKLHPEVDFTVKQVGSGPGATALIEGRCQIATMSRFMKPEEFKLAVEKGVMPTNHAIALDGICVIVHPSNPVKNLTKAQIRDIYTGKVTNWKDLGGADMPVVVISRDSASGTYETFTHFIMGKEKMAGSVEMVNANAQMQARVKTTQGAVGYVGLGTREGVKTLDVEGIQPSRETVVSGKYPMSRPLFLFTNGYPELGSVVDEFCRFYLTEQGQKIIEKQEFIPMTNY